MARKRSNRVLKPATDSKADPALRRAIRAELLALFINSPNDPSQQQIQQLVTKYQLHRPELARYTSTIVNAYSAHLRKTFRQVPQKPVQATQLAVSQPLNNATTNHTINGGATPQIYTPVQPTNVPEPPAQTSPAQPADLSFKVELDNDSDNQVPHCLLMQEFREHLTGNTKGKVMDDTFSPLPSLEEQSQYLASKDYDDKLTGAMLSENLEHASLVSPLLEDSGYSMPSQFALLGEVKLPYNPDQVVFDTRVMLNTIIPFSAFICGLQGSGKSHTTSCMIENCSMTASSLGRLKSSVSTLVLHFNEYSSNASFQPSEAAFISSLLPQYSSQRIDPIPLRVLVSPTNYHNLAKMYSHIPNVEVRRFQIQPSHLNISMMLSLMSISQGNGTPLYMAQVLRVLREMEMQSGGAFNYSESCRPPPEPFANPIFSTKA